MEKKLKMLPRTLDSVCPSTILDLAPVNFPFYTIGRRNKDFEKFFISYFDFPNPYFLFFISEKLVFSFCSLVYLNKVRKSFMNDHFQEMVNHRWHFFTRQKVIREFQESGLFTNEMVHIFSYNSAAETLK